MHLKPVYVSDSCSYLFCYLRYVNLEILYRKLEFLWEFNVYWIDTDVVDC
jgi:hypothetical protein